MIRGMLATAALAASVLTIGATSQRAVAQWYGTACPPGYDARGGHCVPNTNRQRHHSYGAACPPGYDGRSGQCIRSGDGGGHVRRHQGGYQYYDDRPRRRHGVACPRGYNAIEGQCVPNAQ